MCKGGHSTNRQVMTKRMKWDKVTRVYRIALYFRGAKILRIGLAHNFAEIIFADRGLLLATPIYSCPDEA